MDNLLKNGVYPAMITPYTNDNEIDFDSVRNLVDWYVDNGCVGVFAACQSSELLYLSFEEAVELVKTVVDQSKGRLDVVACGCTSENLDEMIEQIRVISKLGVKAVVLLTNHLAGPDDDDSVLLENLSYIMEKLPNVDLGLYECPVPYKRLLTPEILEWCAKSDRFVFMKDTSCNLEQLEAKCKAVKGSKLKLFNANTETLLSSITYGASGICGIMCNYHPYLYSIMIKDYFENGNVTDYAQQIQYLLTTLGYTYTGYPASAKYYLMLENVLKTYSGRMPYTFDSALKYQVEHLHRFTKSVEESFKKTKPI